MDLSYACGVLASDQEKRIGMTLVAIHPISVLPPIGIGPVILLCYSRELAIILIRSLACPLLSRNCSHITIQFKVSVDPTNPLRNFFSSQTTLGVFPTMSHPTTARDIVLNLPSRFKPQAAKHECAIFHFQLEGDTGGQFTVRVNNGQCAVEEGLSGDAECVIAATASDFEDAELGRINKQMAVMTGKIRISNLGAMLKFLGVFEDLKTA